MERRAFIETAVKVGGVAGLGVVTIPPLLTLFSPVFSAGEPLWVRVGAVAEFPVGAVQHAIVEVPRDDRMQSLRRQGVFVLRTQERDFTVFSRTCTDLGCPVTWDPGSGWFFCPCHGGIFDRDGTPQAGPPKRPLYRFATRIDAADLWIDLRSVPPMA